jgi:hypothetical protein
MSTDELDDLSMPPPASIEPPAADVLLRALVPPYRLGAILLRIAELRLTGQLSLGHDVARRTIYFHSGFPVFSESSLFGERLGAVGVRHGLLTRDAVSRALTYARERSCGLGLALLELGRVDAAGLFALLGVQLREVVAASCGGEPLRARFQTGRNALRHVMILRLHPLTAVLTAVSALPAEEQAKLLGAVGARPLLDTAMPQLAQQWLADLGYLGDLDRLCTGTPNVSALPARLAARHQPESEKFFDPAYVAFSLPATRDATEKLTPEKVAELATLTLLLSGSLKLEEKPDAGSRRERVSSNPAPSSLQLSLEGALEEPLKDVRAAPSSSENDAEYAIEAYLTEGRDRAPAAAAAVWGASVEARDAAIAPQLMKLYLTLKPEKRPHVVLDLEPSPSSDELARAYAARVELLSSLAQPDASANLRCRAAELLQCFDDALVRLSTANGAARNARESSAGSVAAAAAEPMRSTSPGTTRSTAPSAARSTAPGTARSAPPGPARNTTPNAARTTEPGGLTAPVSASIPPPPAELEAVATKVEALMRVSNWQGVLETLDVLGADSGLPFTLKLARAMAQRELEVHTPPPRSKRWIGALALGLFLGIALSAALGPWLGSLFGK